MSKPHLNIVHINSNRWNSAITEYSVNSAHALKLLGHTNVYIGLANSPSLKRASRLDIPSLALTHFDVRSLRVVADLLAARKPDAVITYGGQETTLTRLLALQIPLVQSFSGRQYTGPFFQFRGQDVTSFSLWARLRQTLAHQHVQQLICPSRSLKERLEQLIAPSQNVVSIPLGCNTELFYRPNNDPNNHPNSHVKAERPTLLIFGRFDPVKGHREFLGFFAELVNMWDFDTPKPFLKIVGQAANLSTQELLQHVDRLGLSSEVAVIEERVNDVASLMAQATLGVVPSLGSEVICRVAQEFLLCGTPVAVSNAGSLVETLTFPGAGFNYLAPPASERVLAFARKLFECYNESEQTRHDRAQEAKTYFSLETMGHALESLIQKKAPQTDTQV